MNVRDPLKLRDPSSALDYLRNGASDFQQRAVQSSRRLLASVQDNSKKFDDLDDDDFHRPPPPSFRTNDTHASAMSYALPQNGPTQRHTSTANGETSGTIGEKMSTFFAGDKASLPMYKDKPFQYPTSSRQAPWFRKRRILAGVLVIVTGLVWWSGLFNPSAKSADSASPKPAQQPSTNDKAGTWFGSKKSDWAARADIVKGAFRVSWAGYEEHAWGYDEYHPISKSKRQMTPDGLGWIIVDAIDTLMLMNLTDELTHARSWLANHTYDQNHDVNTFETTIRMLGGLLSAHYLSTSFNGKYGAVSDGLSEDLYVEKATDLADRLLGAYNSASGIPFASVNLHTREGIPSHADGGASSTAEATTLQLEMKYLAKVTGEEHYWKTAEKTMEVIDGNNARDGLVPIYVYADRGTFREDNIRLGSRGDSYYEYLIKQYLQTSEQEPEYQAMWNESFAGVKKHLLTYSKPSNFLVLAERPNGLMKDLSPKVDHLVCFMPGTIALATTGGATLAQARKSPSWGAQQEEDMAIAEELMKTCWGMYKVTATGLAPEIAHFNIYDPPKMYNDYSTKTMPRPKSPEKFEPANGPDFEGHYVGMEDYVIHQGDHHNLQRPETVESLFYMWRITGDEKYREWGWEMFKSFVQWTATPNGDGFSSLKDVTTTPPGYKDNMESFWLAETLKYFYLLFSSDDILPLTDVVFNTEAHALPRFQLGKLFKTGWSRRPRDVEGNIIGASITPPVEAKDAVKRPAEQIVTRVVEQAAGAASSAAALLQANIVEPVLGATTMLAAKPTS
ncbi:hypothetical protein AMS68_005619 [Peltaster fructicola]|uniref:alpha-1,2-Mannosidase n=1 Tax=Peltaster fructicola TaxID=286661 RepID=A0A6H0XZA2_9PEZI|nr:hypothetical protein AMS68_005619 [Peltaster fructicola]